MPGADPNVVHVRGECIVASSSIELELRPGNEGVVDDPKLLVLELVSREPPAGDTTVAEKEVSWRDVAGETVTNVRIQGEASASIQVRDVQLRDDA